MTSLSSYYLTKYWGSANVQAAYVGERRSIAWRFKVCLDCLAADCAFQLLRVELIICKKVVPVKPQ